MSIEKANFVFSDNCSLSEDYYYHIQILLLYTFCSVFFYWFPLIFSSIGLAVYMH